MILPLHMTSHTFACCVSVCTTCICCCARSNNFQIEMNEKDGQQMPYDRVEISVHIRLNVAFHPFLLQSTSTHTNENCYTKFRVCTACVMCM